MQKYNPQLFTKPLSYTTIRTQQKITIDGNLSEKDWQNVPWSSSFTDIEGDIKPKPAYNTQMKMLWDDTCLYVAAQLQEPQLNATLLQHDTIVFYNNDFEIFIDPDNDTHQYFEIEVNALNTIFDLFMTKPYRNGADALIGYDVQGLQSAIKLKGMLNKSSDTDSGWTVEMMIPFRALNFGFRTSFTPTVGSFYRINFSRVEWDWDVVNGSYVKRKDANGKNLPEHNWVWSQQGVINMHYPERWGYLFFGDNRDTNYEIPATEEVKNYLWLVYYKQRDFFEKNRKYATELSQLQVSSTIQINQENYSLSLTSISTKFIAEINDTNNKIHITIDEEGKVKQQ